MPPLKAPPKPTPPASRTPQPAEPSPELRQAEADHAQAQKELAWELSKAAVDVAGMVAPTPISDAVGAGMSLAEGDLIGAGLSLVSMVPYAGDALGKTAKGARAAKKISQLREKIAGLTAKISKLKATNQAEAAKISEKAADAIMAAKPAPNTPPSACVPCAANKGSSMGGGSASTGGNGSTRGAGGTGGTGGSGGSGGGSSRGGDSGGRGDGSIKLSEAKRLVKGWAKDPVKGTVADSIKYHFKRHGTEVGASNEWQYLRKAEAFNQNLRGARKSYLPDGRTRYMKDGKYIIKDAEGKIISYGLER